MKEEIQCQGENAIRLPILGGYDFRPCPCRAKYKVTYDGSKVGYFCGRHIRQAEKNYFHVKTEQL